MNPTVGGSSPPQVGTFSVSKLWHFHTNSCVESECCFPRTVNISSVNLTSNLYIYCIFITFITSEIIAITMYGLRRWTGFIHFYYIQTLCHGDIKSWKHTMTLSTRTAHTPKIVQWCVSFFHFCFTRDNVFSKPQFRTLLINDSSNVEISRCCVWKYTCPHKRMR